MDQSKIDVTLHVTLHLVTSSLKICISFTFQEEKHTLKDISVSMYSFV